MALSRQNCVNHPDRPAMGVCVMTRKPICGECSTRYQGVNYSREGLAMLRAQRDAEQHRHRRRAGVWLVLLGVLSPVLMLLLAMFFAVALQGLIDLQEQVQRMVETR